MPGAWISGQPRARAVSPGKFNPVIYVAKCWVPAAPHRLVFSDTEAVTGASFTATSGCLRVPRTAGRTAPDANDRCPRLSSNLAMSRATSAVSWTPIGSLTGVVRLAGLGHENHLPRMTLWSKTSRERLSVARHRGGVQRLARSGCGTTIASPRAGALPAHRSVRQAGARRVPCRQAVAGLGSPGAIAPGTEVAAHPAALPLDLARYALRALS